VDFSPKHNALWSAEIPTGHSSPSVWGDHVVITGFDATTKTLAVIDLDRASGRVRWKREVHPEAIENLQPTNSPASATAVIDGERVYVYFGSAGLFAWDLSGKPAWSIPMPVAKLPYGSGTSPIVAGDAVILARYDSATGFLLAVDRKTGRQMWKAPFSIPGIPGYSTPLIWRDQLVLHQARSVKGYGIGDGKELWSVSVSSEGTGTPAIVGDMLYVGAAFQDEALRDPIPDWKTLVEKYDRDGDGFLSKEEFPDDLAALRRTDAGSTAGAVVTYKRFFDGMLDQNHDGKVSKEEWENVMQYFRSPPPLPHGILAIRLGGTGDVTKTNIVWSDERGAPEVPTPLLYRGRLFAIANGGILSVLDAASGKLMYRARVGAGGMYYSSPVVAGGRVYVASDQGVVTVLEAESSDLKVVAHNDLEEPVFATPAIVDGKIYVRTRTHLYAFGEQ
jgi:outer membrane protein assembly factor BamB